MKFLPDIISLIGLALLGYGLFLFSPRLSYTICGSLMLIYGVVVDYLSAPKTKRLAN